MLRKVFLFNIFIVYFVNSYVIEPGPKYPPTKGEIWPKPQNEVKKIEFFTYNPADFNFKVTGHSCPILLKAVERYLKIPKLTVKIARHNKKNNLRSTRYRKAKPSLNEMKDDNNKGLLGLLEIKLANPCEEYPHFDMDESYNLTVSAASVLSGNSIWGILRGLESFVQLFYITDDLNEIRINSTDIVDFPRYKHRGLLIDTSRHFISVPQILKIIGGMAMNKLNVLHWHIVDDQSFPYQSEKFPELSDLGAYQPSMVYSKVDIRHIIQYARYRGIRVLPEFDVPGHTRSWGVAYPDVLAKCYEGSSIIGLGPLDPSQNATYKLLRDLFNEVQQVFPDRYFHIGGDEITLDCWISNPDIVDYMENNDIKNVNDLLALFMRRAIEQLSNDSIPIVWQEVFDEGVPLKSGTLIQVWKDHGTEMKSVIKAGYQVVYSSSWYLDHLSSGGDWEVFYQADPRQMVDHDGSHPELSSNVVGGEACMWGEVVDDSNVASRIWPRASAVAEVLWSDLSPKPPLSSVYKDQQTSFEKPGSPFDLSHEPTLIFASEEQQTLFEEQDNYYYSFDLVRKRIEEQTCRMLRRGVPAQPPNGPGFCVV